jgi:hypothetical protein
MYELNLKIWDVMGEKHTTIRQRKASNIEEYYFVIEE